MPHLEVRDWPYKPMRGAHIYMPGRDDIPFFKRLLAWLASLRYNTLFLEVGGGMRYDRHPEVNEAWARFCEEVLAYPGGPRGLQSSQPYPKDSTHTELGGGRLLEKSEVADLVAYANSLRHRGGAGAAVAQPRLLPGAGPPRDRRARPTTPGRTPTAPRTRAPTSSTSICWTR